MSRAMEQTEKRLVELHKLRDQLDMEIRGLEAAMVRAALAAEKARALNIKRRRNRKRKIAECGTPSGYYRHRRTPGEPACDACKMAHRVAEQIRVEKQRKRAEA